MKILIISDAWRPQLNGVVRTYQALEKKLTALSYDVKIIGPADFKHTMPMPGYAEIRLTLMPYRHLKSLIQDYAPDSIHIATEGPLGWAAQKYCRRRQIKFTSCYHTRFPEYVALRVSKVLPILYKPVFKLAVRIIRKFHASASALFVTTPTMAAQLKEFGIKTPLYPLTRGVDTKVFHPGEKNLFQDLKKPIALYVGRLAVEKNIEEFLEMDWQGSKIVVGHGPDEQKLKSKYPNAIFTGKVEGKALADHYRSADIFVFPSRTDTFGIVLIEALSCGLPIAAHNVAGPHDVVINNQLGILSEDLSQAATQALRHGSPQERHEHVLKNYSWEMATQQFLEAQKNILQK